MVGEEWPGLVCSRACSPLPRGWICRSPMATGSYDVTVKTSLLGLLSLGENGIRAGAGTGWEEGGGWIKLRVNPLLLNFRGRHIKN